MDEKEESANCSHSAVPGVVKEEGNADLFHVSTADGDGQAVIENAAVECDVDTSRECSNQGEVVGNPTSGTADCEDEFPRPDVLSMIDRLLDEDPPMDEPCASVSIPPEPSIARSPNTINYSDRLFLPTNGYYEQPTQHRTDDDCRYGIGYTGYKPPSQVKVQLNFNGQQTVTSTSLQDFRRLIGLKDSPRKSYHPAGYRRPLRGYDYRNGFHEADPINVPQRRTQMDCATRFAIRFGKMVCDELRDCLINLRRITDVRTQTEKVIVSRPWMMTLNGDPWNLPPPSDSCCMIDWLVFEFLKEYCNTNNFLKNLDQGSSSITTGEALSLMKEWLDQIRFVDSHRRAGFCDCSCQRANLPADKALQLLRGLNNVTERVNGFVSNLTQLVRPSFPVTGMFKGTIN